MFIPGNNRYAFVRVFDQRLGAARCNSACGGIDRENVTWCVRLADVNKIIETCLYLDENNEVVFQSTRDAQYLELENYLSLPTVRNYTCCCILLLLLYPHYRQWSVVFLPVLAVLDSSTSTGFLKMLTSPAFLTQTTAMMWVSLASLPVVSWPDLFIV